MIAELPARERLHWRVMCDPAEPILADHRPGGAPLLGTVGNLDMIASGLAERVPEGEIVAIEEVRLGPPLIFADKAPLPLDIAADTATGAATGADGCLAVRSFSAPSPADAPHLAACFRMARRFAPAPAFAAPTPGPDAITTADIYAVLFHGPAFRVIDRAALAGSMLVAASCATLPPLRRPATASRLAPRAIEFGLQAAGLLQLALDGSMAIPLGIERIERFADTDVGTGAALFARAERTPDGRFAIEVGHGGATIVRITGYATTPLPFAHDDRAARTLAARLNERRR
ncbi:MAG: polyketide synthase dehydratase domain-containing protein [Sphingomicrobium sp.]